MACLNLEVQFQRELHLPRRVDLIAGGLAQDSERLRLYRQRALTETHPVKCIEHLGAKVRTESLADRKCLGQREVLVVVREGPELRIVSGHIAEGVRGLRGEEAGRLN